MKLILVRHGETVENALGINQGHLPGRLNENGINQAECLAEKLKNRKIDYIYSSDLARAADTAKIIAKFHPNVSIELVELLRELYMSGFQGRPHVDLDWNNPPKDAETYFDLFVRAGDFLDLLRGKIFETVLIVAHNGINLAIKCVIEGINVGELRDIPSMKNCDILELELV